MRHSILLLALFFFGCRGPFDTGDERVAGIIQEIEVPANVAVGEGFTVSIQTGWRNGCARMGETEVEVDGLNIIVIPYDIITEDGSLCAQSPQVFTHTASIRVDEPGTANLIVKGRQDFGGDVVTFERQLEVK